MSSLESVVQKTFGIGIDKTEANALKSNALAEQQANNNLLAQQISAQRAKMGALGIDPDSGSSAAVIQNLTKETNAKNQQTATTANQKIKANLNAQSKQNLKSLINGSAEVGAALLA